MHPDDPSAPAGFTPPRPNVRRSLRPRWSDLAELAAIFLLLGITGFGGPTAHLIRMRTLFVEQRRWLDDEQFALMLGAANLIPGPTSTEFALHVGMKRAGLPGLLVSGICFIAPAALICGSTATLAPAWRETPAWAGAVTATTASVVCLLAFGFPSFAKPLLRRPVDWTVALGGAVTAALGSDPLWTLFGSGLLMSLVGMDSTTQRHRYMLHCFLLLIVTILLIVWAKAVPFGFGNLPRVAHPAAVLAEFAAIGSSLYGNGNLLLAFADQRLVEHLGWIDAATLREAVAVGQATPGPVFAMASYLGMRLAGVAGAMTATVGIFLPAFLLVGVSSRFLDKMRHSEALLWFLTGLNAASVGTMAIVIFDLARGITNGWLGWIAFGVAAGCFWKTRINVAWVIVGCGTVGSLAGWQMPYLIGR